MEGPENRVVLLTRKQLRINGFSPGRSIAERWDSSDAESLAPFRLPPFPFLGSIVETCRRLGLPLRDYLSSVLPGLADFPSNRVAELTPKAWAASI
jgi:hypothetical protein